MKEAGAVINEIADKQAFQDAVKPVWDKYGAAAQSAHRSHQVHVK